MRTALHFFARGNRRAAFTRIELVVVLLVVAMLTGLGTSVIRGTKNQVKIAQCAGNLRQFALSHLLYAADNSDNMPAPAAGSFGGSWAWDLDGNVGNVLNQYGTPPATMYCPGTAPRFQPTNNMELYHFGATLHVIGYALTLPGMPAIPSTNMNFSVIPRPIQSGSITIPPPRASQRVLIADANLTTFGSGNYNAISGGYRLPHLCPHLDGFVPAGGNLAMLDGHVEWRQFSQMQVRTFTSVNGTATPVFYW